MNMYRRQMLAASMTGNPHLTPPLHQLKGAPTQPAAAFDAWSKIAFLNSNPMAKQANPLRGLLSVKSNQALGLNRNININIAQNIHLNPTPPPSSSSNTGRNLIAEKNTRIRNEINRMIFSNTSNLVDRYACNKCNRSYRNKNHLYRHVRYECDRKKRYQCGICMKDFYRKDNLKTHISYKHSEYKSSNYILINKEEEVDDELHLDAHNNNNLVISKNELNDLLNKNDNTQQVLSILNNNESTKNVSPSESAKQFLHLKLQQEQSKLQKSLLLRIQTENNKITQSQSEVLTKLLSSKSTPVQLNLPSRQLEIHPTGKTQNINKSSQRRNEDAKVRLSKNVDLIDLEENSDDNELGDRSLDTYDEDDDEYVEGLEPFVHIDIDSYNNVDIDPYVINKKDKASPCNEPSSLKKVHLGSTEEIDRKHGKSRDSPSRNKNTPELNSELKSMLAAKTIDNKLAESESKINVEKKTDAENETCKPTEKAPKEQSDKTEDTQIDSTISLPNKSDGKDSTDTKHNETTSANTETEPVKENKKILDQVDT